ncbi:MAG TPA: nucleoside deaminase [Solirubrobacteraceae bacterium]|nr:nucleoside deaminase [Solirubrobacteraceae bacterium]
MTERELMSEALRLATASAATDGGPFAALVVRDGEVIARGANRVVADRDPTAHAEVVALRAAAHGERTHDLSGTLLVTTCEPCPMCLGAAWWARVDAVLFAAGREDASAAGFDDAALYAEVAAPLAGRRLPVRRVDVPDPCAPFAAWEANPNRVPY